MFQLAVHLNSYFCLERFWLRARLTFTLFFFGARLTADVFLSMAASASHHQEAASTFHTTIVYVELLVASFCALSIPIIKLLAQVPEVILVSWGAERDYQKGLR